eukprot:4611301-Prymnesium_polylepis.2
MKNVKRTDDRRTERRDCGKASLPLPGGAAYGKSCGSISASMQRGAHSRMSKRALELTGRTTVAPRGPRASSDDPERAVLCGSVVELSRGLESQRPY